MEYYVCTSFGVSNKYYSRYGYEVVSLERANEIKKALYKIETIDKPIKGLSSYKVSELQDIAIRLEISLTKPDTGKSRTKNDLYELILQYF